LANYDPGIQYEPTCNQFIGIFQHFDDPVFGLRTRLDQSYPRARQIPQRTDWGWGDKAGTNEAMRSQLRNPASIRLVGLGARAPPHLLGIPVTSTIKWQILRHILAVPSTSFLAVSHHAWRRFHP